MKKTLLALATSAVLAGAALMPTTAEAGCRGCGVAAGVLGDATKRSPFGANTSTRAS